MIEIGIVIMRKLLAVRSLTIIAFLTFNWRGQKITDVNEGLQHDKGMDNKQTYFVMARICWVCEPHSITNFTFSFFSTLGCTVDAVLGTRRQNNSSQYIDNVTTYNSGSMGRMFCYIGGGTAVHDRDVSAPELQ